MKDWTTCEERADILFINGQVYTVNQERAWAQAVAVKGKKILCVGTNEDVVCCAGAGTQIVNLQGRMMLPGLIDSHAHPILAAYFKSGILCDITQTMEETLETIRRYVEENPDLPCYFGQGFSEWMMDPKSPQRQMLDQICADKPILLLGAGGHSGWCNTKALEMAGITKDTPDPDPGAQFFRRDEAGVPTGGLVETSTTLMIMDAIHPFRRESVQAALEKVAQAYAQAGVTAIQDGGSMEFMLELGRPLVTDMQRKGLLALRIQSCEFVSAADMAKDAVKKISEAKKTYDDDYFRVNFLKILNDGTFEARSAALLEPYTFDGSQCHPMLEGEALKKLFLEAAEAGMDIGVHGIGDWTVREILLATKALREAGYRDTRVTEIHSNYIDSADLDKFAKYDVIANTTAVWHHTNPDKERIIGARAHENYRMNTLYKQGVRLTFGSDFPADEYGKEPLKGIEMGITRQMYGQPEDPVLLPLSERLTVAKMIEGYTINGAYQMRMEDKIGSIEAGKYADLVVLAENLFEIDPRDIHRVSVEMTVFDGKIVYQK